MHLKIFIMNCRYFLTFGTERQNGKYTSHLTHKFPWLASQLIRKKLLKVIYSRKFEIELTGDTSIIWSNRVIKKRYRHSKYFMKILYLKKNISVDLLIHRRKTLYLMINGKHNKIC